MSYPPLSGYGGHYDSTQNQSGNNAYGSSRQSGSTSYGQQYSADERISQYPPPSGYDWSNQAQQGYTSGSQQSCDSWRETNGQTSQYDYRRDNSAYATQATGGNTQTYYGGSSSSTPATSSMAGLNNLAYASGLDNQRSVSHSQQPSSKYSTTRAPAAPNRVQSPAQPQHQSYVQQQPSRRQQHQQEQQQQNYTYPTQNVSPNTQREMTLNAASRNLEVASQNLAISAAQALAGAVTRKNQSVRGSQPPRSPATKSSNVNSESQSAYPTASVDQNHTRTPSAQSQRNHVKPPTNVTASPNTGKARATAQPAATHVRRPSQPKRSVASQSNSISNLVASTTDVTSPIVATDTMPAYIDPTQVFNPYHREHERRRKEVAESEARKKVEEAAAAKKAQEAQAKKQKAPAPPEPSPTTPAVSDKPAATEDDMAAEMKAMIEKMKTFRQKDPSMFQKLWDDMRKPPTTNGCADTVQSPSPQITQRQAVPSANPQPATATPTEVPTPLGPTDTTSKEVSGSQAPKSRAKAAPCPPNAFPHAQANGWKVVVEDNDEAMPDLGRFPAERRIRSGYRTMNTPGTQPIPTASAGSFPRLGLAGSKSVNTPPGQVPGPLPAKTASGGVEWPKDKRDALAKATIDALKAVPENKDVEITTDDIHTMLEENPSYIQLCDLLEKKGLKFHRGHFARQLLVNVPDLTTPQKAKEAPPPHSAPTPATAPPNLGGPPSEPSMAPSGYPIPPNTFAPFPPGQAAPAIRYPPPVYGPPPPNHFQTTSAYPPVKSEFAKAVSKVKKASMPPARPEPPPGSKEAMARKRDFSELIDLTQLSDNDDYVLSSKHPRLNSPSPEPDPFEKYHLEANMQPPTLGSDISIGSSSVNLPRGTPLRFDPLHRYPMSQAPLPPPPPPPQPKRTILAKPVNKSEALRKSYYDPKTVARDILIAAGRHPQERPLNAHMASLLGKHIELDSDLNTFDWDAIDPGGPPVRKVEYVDIPAAPPRFPLGQRTNLEIRKAQNEASGKAEAQNPRLPDLEKRDSETPATATATARAPPGPQSSKDRLVLKYYSGRGRPPRGSIRAPKPSRLRETQDVQDATSPASANSPPQEAASDSVDSTPQKQTLRSSSRQVPDSMESNSLPKRKGRPPGSKNKHVSVAVMKKFGTPVPRAQAASEVPPASPPRPVFKCRWKKCGTELHNLDTLRKHIARVHRPSEQEIGSEGFVCWWKNCQYLQADEEGDVEPSHVFASAEAWMAHINEDHLHKVAMKHGDGPNTAQVDSQTVAEDKIRYLSDSQGRATTAAVTKKGNHELPHDTMTFTTPIGNEAEAAAQKAFLKAHRPGEKIGEKVTAEETFKAMEARKAKIGPGIDRGGCTLVNDARRATFLQSPGFRRIVDADY